MDLNKAKAIHADGEALFYELRIALGWAIAELARVKAESLRVVAMTEDRSPLNIDTVVRHAHIDGRVVRLERWETEE